MEPKSFPIYQNYNCSGSGFGGNGGPPLGIETFFKEKKSCPKQISSLDFSDSNELYFENRLLNNQHGFLTTQ